MRILAELQPDLALAHELRDQLRLALAEPEVDDAGLGHGGRDLVGVPDQVEASAQLVHRHVRPRLDEPPQLGGRASLRRAFVVAESHRAAPGSGAGSVRSRGSLAGGADGLSAREIEVLRLVAEGKTNRDIGEALGLSALTVKSHLARIARKLGTGDRAQMVALAMRAGVIR